MEKLRKSFSDGQAWQSEDHGGKSTLYELMKALLQAFTLTAYQATIATATLNAVIVKNTGKLTGLRVAVGTTGDSSSTIVQVHLNGVSQGSLEVDNTDADGTALSLDLDVSLAANDLVAFVVSQAAGNAAALAVTADISPAEVE